MQRRTFRFITGPSLEYFLLYISYLSLLSSKFHTVFLYRVIISHRMRMYVLTMCVVCVSANQGVWRVLCVTSPQGGKHQSSSLVVRRSTLPITYIIRGHTTQEAQQGLYTRLGHKERVSRRRHTSPYNEASGNTVFVVMRGKCLWWVLVLCYVLLFICFPYNIVVVMVYLLCCCRSRCAACDVWLRCEAVQQLLQGEARRVCE